MAAAAIADLFNPHGASMTKIISPTDINEFATICSRCGTEGQVIGTLEDYVERLCPKCYRVWTTKNGKPARWPDANEYSFIMVRRQKKALEYFNRPQRYREPTERRPLLLLAWVAEPYGYRVIPEARETMPDSVGELYNLLYRIFDHTSDFDPETVAAANKVYALLRDKKYEELKALLDEYNALQERMPK
jgi:hypothetical protein